MSNLSHPLDMQSCKGVCTNITTTNLPFSAEAIVLIAVENEDNTFAIYLGYKVIDCYSQMFRISYFCNGDGSFFCIETFLRHLYIEVKTNKIHVHGLMKYLITQVQEIAITK